MKRFLILLSLLFCTTVFAQTEIINWYMDGQTYATTTCETGGNIALPTQPVKYGYTFQGWRDYIPIEYLESTGTQWIDTGVILNADSKIRVKFLRSDLLYSRVMGVRGTYTSNNISIIGDTYSLDTIHIDFNNGSYSTYRLTDVLNYRGIVIAEASKTARTLYGPEDENIVLSRNTNICPHNFNITKNALLFNVGDENGNPFIGRIYYAKIWDNDILIRDFIPVIDGNNIPCMYDKIEGKFYHNVNADNFIAGPVINE